MIEVASCLLDEPTPFGLVEHLAMPPRGSCLRDRRGRRVESRPGRGRSSRGCRRPRCRLRTRTRAAVGRRRGSAHPAQERVRGELGRREVAEVLVDPVRDQRAGDPLRPPRLGPHLRHPGGRRVPVVVHVVVVEDHRARQGRKQPAQRRVAPRLAMEARVLVEVSRPPVRAARGHRVGRGCTPPSQAGSRQRKPGRRAAASVSSHTVASVSLM